MATSSPPRIPQEPGLCPPEPEPLMNRAGIRIRPDRNWISSALPPRL